MTPAGSGCGHVVDDALLRALTPEVLSVLVRRGADFASAEDAVQEALVRAVTVWPVEPPRDPKGWLITTAWHAFIDQARSSTARRAREARTDAAPPPGTASDIDDTLEMYVLCAHPALTRSSAVALMLRAIGGLTTKQIADAYLVPEATMAQRISRAKRIVSDVRLDQPGDLGAVMHTLYLVFNEGYSGDMDLAAEAIRLTRQLSSMVDEPEAYGLLALMLLHHARRDARTGVDGRLILLAEQDRAQWDRSLISEGVVVIHAALRRDRLGPYQAQAAIAALHADAPDVDETDWEQIVEWYDELITFADTPIIQLNRAVAIGESRGAGAGLTAITDIDPSTPRFTAVAAHLHESNGNLELAANMYALASVDSPNVPEREHQARQAARINAILRDNPHHLRITGGGS